MKGANNKEMYIDITKSVGTSSTTILEVPKGFIFEIDSIYVQKDGNAGTITITDEGTYKDGSTAYSKTIHTQYLAANEYDDTREMKTRAFATIKGVSSAGNTTVTLRGRLI